MSRSRKRAFQYGGVILAIAVLILAAWHGTGIGVVLADLGADHTLNWLGILITVFSLSVTFFLAIMAIEAFSHLGALREASDNYDLLVEKLKVDESRFDEIRTALTVYNGEILAISDKFIQQSEIPDKEKLRFSKKYQVARARLELASMSQEEISDTELVTRHVLVLSEHGGISDLKFALEVLKKTSDPIGTYGLVGEIIRDLKKREAKLGQKP